MLASLGDAAAASREIGYANGAAVSAEDSQRYTDGVKAANRLVFGSDKPPEKRHGGVMHSREDRAFRGHTTSAAPVEFSGRLSRSEGKSFGFVRSREYGDIFIPPKFAAKMRDGELVLGVAAMREDKKKKRMALCMLFAL